ncbi:MAG: hypothetical protein ACJAS9_001999 [Polaribacter sp.]|jgi:hypothetical protein
MSHLSLSIDLNENCMQTKNMKSNWGVGALV